MEATFDAATTTNLKSLPAEEPQFDLYSIPISSGWFSWGAIHETERKSLKEFFDGSSISRTPKIYREYRDFIINKYREEPSRRLTFTEIRKSLIGDVSLLLKVFNFLDKWGLINFSASLKDEELGGVELGGEENFKVKVEEGAPNGIRVVAMPNSLKPISVPLSFEGNGELPENGAKFLPLGSYADVFGDLVRVKRLVCGNCGEDCVSGHHECTKEGFSMICVKCYNEGKYGENKSIDDFKYMENSGNTQVWTEEETLLLLESVMKHGDDWELVAQSIPSKSRFDCISKLIQLPFGELMLGSTNTRDTSIGVDESLSSIKLVPLAASEFQDPIHLDNMSNEQKKNIENNVDLDEETEGPPLKKLCIPGGSLMKQVALISSMVSPDITAAAADAAISAICIENQLAKEIFNSAGDMFSNEVGLPGPESESERGNQIEDLDTKERPILSETQDIHPYIPLTLRMKAAIATALGAAASHSKLLADQEEREMEHVVAAIIETQLKKLQYKVKLLEDLEEIMENEYSLIEELEESIISERINVLQRLLNSGVSRWKDHTSVKS